MGTAHTAIHVGMNSTKGATASTRSMRHDPRATKDTDTKRRPIVLHRTPRAEDLVLGLDHERKTGIPFMLWRHDRGQAGVFVFDGYELNKRRRKT